MRTVDALAMLAMFGLAGCETTDERDQKALRERAGIPPMATMAGYKGYPARVGFGQREGLEVSGQYRLTDDQARAFEAGAADDGWLPLPMPAALRAMIPYRGLPVDLDAADGLYRCRTAGDNVLHSSVSRPCREVDSLNDIMLSIYRRPERILDAVVRSSY